MIPVDSSHYLGWFRDSASYFSAHREKVVVLAIAGEALEADNFVRLIRDIGLLQLLSLKLVVVFGSRPQINRRLQEQGLEARYSQGLRITDNPTLKAVREVVGTLCQDIEAQLSLGLFNHPTSRKRLQVVSGNFVIAKPVGVRDGTDFRHTGEVRRIETADIKEQLELDNLVLIPPLAPSPTGELFNLQSPQLAADIAIAVDADKLIFIGPGLHMQKPNGTEIHELSLPDIEQRLLQPELDADARQYFQLALKVARHGIDRIHLLDHQYDGALLLELFSRDGMGLLIATDDYEQLRDANINDVGRVLELIEPLEQQGVLVKRSRKRLELEIADFSLLERDGRIIGCAGLMAFENGFGELHCLVVHSDYQGGERGDRLLVQIEKKARQQQINRLFVLTTHSAHWFQERGFIPAELEQLPESRKKIYNIQRNSRILIKPL